MDYARNYDLLNSKFKELLFPTLLTSIAGNFAMLIDAFFISLFMGSTFLSVVQTMEPFVCFINVVYWLIGFGGSILCNIAKAEFDKKKSNFSKQKQSLFKGPNPFRFSKEAKILMINQPIDASSIKSSCSGSQNIFNSKISSKDKEEININNILKKESDKKIINNNSINDIEIDSDKESLMNILSGFM